MQNKHSYGKTSQAPPIHKTSQEALLINSFNGEGALIKTEWSVEILQQMSVENVCCRLCVYLASIIVGLKLNRQIGIVCAEYLSSKMYVLLQVAT